MILLTGVGTRLMVKQIERHLDKTRFLEALSDVTTIVRGPKPLAALKEFGIEPTVKVPEPNTWGEVLQTIEVDRGCFACMLGGENNRTLFIVAAAWGGAEGMGQGQRTGQVLSVEVAVPGAGWPSHG